MKYILTILVLLYYLLGHAQSNESPLWVDLVPGEYDVGFKVNYLIDSSRKMPSSDSLPHALVGKPIRVKVYYPGKKAISSIRLNFLDQVNLHPKNHQFATYNEILNTRDRRLEGQFSTSSDSLKIVLFRTMTKAYHNIPFAPGKFPLLIYELGLDDHQMENSVLWEYLASHGYAVAVLPSFGFDFQNKFVPYTAKGAIELYNDALTLVNHMKGQPYIDSKKIGAIGHSFGGIVVSLLASKQHDIKGIAALDGSFNNSRALPILNELQIHSASINIPMLNLYTKAHEKDLTFAESVKSPMYQFAFYNASHFDFQNFPLYAFITNTPDQRVINRRSTPEGKDILLSVVRLTRHFFDFVFFNTEYSEAYILGRTTESKKLNTLGVFENRP